MDSITERIKKRKLQLEKRMPSVMQEITTRFEPFRAEFDKKLVGALSENGSRRSKIFKIQKLTSEVRDISRPYVTCSNGCSNCCYQRVMLCQTEADTIAHNIGRSAVQLAPTYPLPDINSFGADTPCPFLVKNSCSIYEFRPFMCRNQVNLDVDDLLCSFENWELGKAKNPIFTGVSMQDPGPLLRAYQQVAKADIAGDIRDFFPKI